MSLGRDSCLMNEIDKARDIASTILRPYVSQLESAMYQCILEDIERVILREREYLYLTQDDDEG